MSESPRPTVINTDEPVMAAYARVLQAPAAERETLLTQLPIEQQAAVRGLLAAGEQTTDPLAAARTASVAGRAPPTVGAWRLLHEIGEGGMGSVFLAERADQQYTGKAAIKFIRGFASRDGMRRLRGERQVLAELDHPYITRLIDGGETGDGQPYLVMEFVEGRTLDVYIEQERPALFARLDLFDRILDAVAHAHSKLIVHRDIKPNKVIVRSDGLPKLLDFGVAKLLTALNETGSNTATLVWTPGYSSPEQSAGQSVGVEADVFSLGVVLSEILAPPLEPDLAAIIAMATAREARERYRSVDALRDDLKRFREALPVRAVRATRWYRLRKFLRRRRWPLAAAFAIGASSALFTWQLDQQRERAVAAERRAIADLNRALAAERAARDQSLRAEQTERFLIDVFSEADPGAASARQVDLLALLNAAAARSADSHADQPALQARIRRTLGGIYRQLGEAKAALDLLAASIPGDDPDDPELALEIASSLVDLGSMELRSANTDAAIAAFERAARLRERFAPNDLALQLQRYVDSSAALVRAGRFDDGERLLDRGIGAARDAGSAGGEALAQLLGSRAELRMEQRRHAEALEASSEALAIARTLPRRNDSALVDYLRQHASILVNNDAFDAAEAHFQEALQLQRRHFGESGSQYANLINDLGVLYVQRGRYADAIPLLERALDVERKAIDDTGLGVAISLHNLASTWMRYGDYARAIELFKGAAAQVRNPDPHHHRQFLSGRLRAEIFGQRLAEARTSLQALEQSIAADPEATDSSRLELAMRRLAFAYVSGAEPTAEIDAVEKAIDALGEIPDSLRANVDYQIGLAQLQFSAQAIARLESALAMRTKTLGAEHVDTALAGAALARAYFVRGDQAQARRYIASAMPALQQHLLVGEYDRVQAQLLAQRLAIEPAGAAAVEP